MSPPGGNQGLPSNKKASSELANVNFKATRTAKVNQPSLCSPAAIAALTQSQTGKQRNQQVSGNKQSTQAIQSNVSTQNMYIVYDKPLDEYDTDMVGEDTHTSSGSRIPQQSSKTQPIAVIGSSASEIQNLLITTVKSGKFEFRLMSNGIRINVNCPDEWKLVQENLIAANKEFFLYHTGATRPKKIALFGLHDMNVDELMHLLTALNVTPVEIKKINLKKQKYDQQAVYILYFHAGEGKLSELHKIKHIEHILVRWELF